MYVVPSQLEMRIWSTKLANESLLPDFYTDFKGVRDIDTPESIPNGIMVETRKENGASTERFSLLKALSEDGAMGRERTAGKEEDQVVTWMDIYANSHSKPVSTANFGVDARNAKWLNLMDRAKPQLARYMQEKRGRFIREALCQVYSYNLTVAPTSLTQAINPNIAFVDNTATTIKGLRSPAYNPTTGTYTTNIQTQATALSATASDKRMSLTALQNIERWIIDQKNIEPLDIDGRKSYVLSISGRQKTNLMDVTSSSSLFTLLKEADVRGSGNKALKNECYRWGSLILVVDPRHPVVTVTGGTVTFSYADAGRVDNRNLAGDATRFDVCIVHGAMALVNYITEGIHYAIEDDDYGKSGGLAVFTTEGFILTQYDDANNKTATSITQQCSALIFAGTL